jgi:uncharacterized Ntn-hydrolase superfamily protein
VAVVDAKGRADAFTGKRTISDAGHEVGTGFAVSANLMKNDKVWPEMRLAFENATGDLAERMLAALDSAQKAGGDLRGKQSAALVVVAARASGRPWTDRIFDVRVDDHREPLRELRRLVTLQRAYNHMHQADLAAERDEHERARAEFRAAEKLAPKQDELAFWHAIALVNMNRVDDALPLLRRLYATDKEWRALVPRLARAGLIPNDPPLVTRLTKP